MLKSHWRKCLAAAIVVVSFGLGTYYGREAITLAYVTFFGQKDAERSHFAYKGANNSKIIVFIHGVTGTPRETWTYQDNTTTPVFWPDLIKTDPRLKDYDIFLLSYYTPVVESGPSIGQIAENMYKDLEQNYILPDRIQSTNDKSKPANYSKLKYKEAVFIAHSMGNLIIRTMMVSNRLPVDSPVQIPLILSLASPSTGSALAELADKLTLNETYHEMISFERNTFLQLLGRVWTISGFDTEIACAYEELSHPRIGKKVVEISSATAVCTRLDPRGFQRDHVSIVKPKDRNDPVYAWTVEEIMKPHKREQWALDRWQENRIIVGGKDYPESNLHAAMIALLLRDRIPQLNVTFNYDMGTAASLFSSLVNNDIDIYPEYDGSLLYEYLHRPLDGSVHETLQSIDHGSPEFEDAINGELGKTALNIRYLGSFGFNNPYILVMKRSEAKRRGLFDEHGKVTISSLMAKDPSNLALVADQLFTYRSEWSNAKKQYGSLGFGAMPLARHSEVYELVRERRPDDKAAVGVGFGTDAELNPVADDLVAVEDDRNAFPSYYAGSLVNRLLLRKFPQIGTELARLKGILTSQEMANLLKEHDDVVGKLKSVEAKKQAVEDIARKFLESKRKFLESKGVL